MSTLYCYINKQIVPIEKAGVLVTDLLVQRGYGIFDYLRVANNKPLFLEDHLERFYNSANSMRLGSNDLIEGAAGLNRRYSSSIARATLPT